MMPCLVMAGAKEGPQLLRKMRHIQRPLRSWDLWGKGGGGTHCWCLCPRKAFVQTARLGKRWCQDDDDDDDVCKPKIHLKCRCPSLGRHTFKPLQLCKYEACVLPHCLWTGTQFPLGDDYYMLSISPSDDSFMPSLGVHELLSFLAECEQISV